jgi:membrane protease YdiL (CAAX protease family)
MRIQPRPSLAWAIGIAYPILFLVLVVVTTLLGWWRPVLRELPADPPRPPRWLLVVPILVFIATLLGIDYGNLGNMGAAMILWLAIGTALVGFSEETTYRGLALVGFRRGYGEVRVWLFTALFFGLLHGANLILGQGAVLTVRQVFFAFVLGSIFYAIRRISGTIVVVMVLHALWDFGSFSHVAGKAGAVAAKIDIATAGAGLLQSLLVLIAVVLVIVGAKKILRPKATAQAAPDPQSA